MQRPSRRQRPHRAAGSMPSRLRNTSECEESHSLKPCVALGVHRHTKQKLAGTASSRRKMARHPAGLPPILLLLLLTYSSFSSH